MLNVCIYSQTGFESLSSRLMRPLDVQQIGNELALKWDDGTESFISLENLRRSCPCAGCKGEVDVMGNLYKNPDRPLSADAFRLVRLTSVGGYAIQPVWADGHSSGLFSFDYLKRVAEASNT
jgi:DUF971 family protein